MNLFLENIWTKKNRNNSHQTKFNQIWQVAALVLYLDKKLKKSKKFFKRNGHWLDMRRRNIKYNLTKKLNLKMFSCRVGIRKPHKNIKSPLKCLFMRPLTYKTLISNTWNQYTYNNSLLFDAPVQKQKSH